MFNSRKRKEMAETGKHRKSSLSNEAQSRFDALKAKAMKELAAAETFVQEQQQQGAEETKKQLGAANELVTQLTREAVPRSTNILNSVKSKVAEVHATEKALDKNTRRLKQLDREGKFEEIAKAQSELMRRQVSIRSTVQ